MDILADTNVILRSLEPRDPSHLRALDALEKQADAGNRLCVTTQNLVELWTVSTRPSGNNGMGLSPYEAGLLIAKVEGFAFRLPDLDATFETWKSLVSTYRVSGKNAHDTRLVACMLLHNVTHILTFNAQDFERFPHISVIVP